MLRLLQRLPPNANKAVSNCVSPLYPRTCLAAKSAFFAAFVPLTCCGPPSHQHSILQDQQLFSMSYKANIGSQIECPGQNYLRACLCKGEPANRLRIRWFRFHRPPSSMSSRPAVGRPSGCPPGALRADRGSLPTHRSWRRPLQIDQREGFSFEFPRKPLMVLVPSKRKHTHLSFSAPSCQGPQRNGRQQHTSF